MIIAFTIIIAQKCHGVVFGNMFRVLLDERLDAIPKRRDCLNIFIQTQDKAILLLVVLHELERVVVNITEQFHTWLDTPVVLELVHEWMSEKEARLEATHVPVADRVTVNDLALRHVFADLACVVLVNEGRKRPVLFRDLAIVSLSRNERSRHLLEIVVKGFVIEEDPIIVVVSVESILNLTY